MNEGTDVSIYLQNLHSDFVSSDTAVKLAGVLVEARYPKNVFQARDGGNVESKSDCWEVTLYNKIDASEVIGTKFKELHLLIKKSTGEFVRVY